MRNEQHELCGNFFCSMHNQSYLLLERCGCKFFCLSMLRNVQSSDRAALRGICVVCFERINQQEFVYTDERPLKVSVHVLRRSVSQDICSKQIDCSASYIFRHIAHFVDRNGLIETDGEFLVCA